MRGEKEPKEGVDFKWVVNEGTNVRTRHFFTKAEKEAMKKPKKAAPKEKPTAKSVKTPKVTTEKLSSSKVGRGRGDGAMEMVRRSLDKGPSADSSSPKRPSAPKAGKSPKRSSGDSTVRRGSIKQRPELTKAEAPYRNDKGIMTQDKPKVTEAAKKKMASKKPPKDLNFNAWKNFMTRNGYKFKPNEAMRMYSNYKQGMSKGGSVTRPRTGHTDHRKKGMFK